MQIIDYSIREGEPLDKFDNLTHHQLTTNFVSISDAKHLLEVRHATYVRKLLLEGQIEGVKIKERHLQKWYVTRLSCSHYVRCVGRKRQPRRYILHIQERDEDSVRSALDNLGIEYNLNFAYNGGK